MTEDNKGLIKMEMGNTDYNIYFLIGFAVAMILAILVPVYFMKRHKDE